MRQVNGFLRVLLFFPPIKLKTPRYSGNIIEIGIKHHNLPYKCIFSYFNEKILTKNNNLESNTIDN